MNEKIIIFLIILWIVISYLKLNFNNNSITKTIMIQRNTIGYWLLINISLFLSNKIFKSYYYSPIIYLIILLIHEFIFYFPKSASFLHLNFTKDEQEVTYNFYKWFNIYTQSIKKHDEDNTDISEGLFDNNWNLTNKQSLKNKFDTYYKYLKLEKGMKLLDIGCGNCHWLNYCRKKGIICYGITLSKHQSEFCEKKGIKTIIGDIQKNILLTINDKFDAISAIGPVEHFSSLSQPLKERIKRLNIYYNQVKNLINPNSKSKRYLNSIMCNNENYSKYHDKYWYYQVYLIASSYGYGYYPTEKEIESIYGGKKSKILIKRDYTEDYRWILVRMKNSWGYTNYKFNSIYQIYNFLNDLLIDPNWWNRFLYAYNNSWFWQFGGTSQKPIPHIKDTPIRSYIYVTEISTK